jgi:hypothetical protein
MDSEDLIAAKNLVAVICRDGGHHIEAVGFKQACENAQAHFVRLRTLIDDVLYSGGVVCDQLEAHKSERFGDHDLSEVILLNDLKDIRKEILAVEGWERKEESER